MTIKTYILTPKLAFYPLWLERYWLKMKSLAITTVTMETVDFRYCGTKIFFGELMILKVDVLGIIKISKEFSSKG